jgi:hypothetical protein
MGPEQFTRKYLVDLLRKTGYAELADEAERVLPETFDYDEIQRWAVPHGITIDQLISRMGGSP